jgi:hypothetical protein
MPLSAQVVAARVQLRIAELRLLAAKQFCAPTRKRVLPPSVAAPARRPRPIPPLWPLGPGGDGR